MAETIKTRIRITRYSTNGVSRYWEDPEGLGREGGGRGESGWGIHVNPWLIHVNV